MRKPSTRVRSVISIAAAATLLLLSACRVQDAAVPLLTTGTTTRVTLRISAEGTEAAPITPANPVYLTVDISNHGPAFGLPLYDPLEVFRAEVLGPAGTACPLTEYGRHVARRVELGSPLSGGTRTIEPGQRLTERFALNRYFDMTVDGVYSVRLAMPLSGPHGERQRAISNSISIYVAGRG